MTYYTTSICVIVQVTDVSTDNETMSSVQQQLGTSEQISITQVVCSKPNYEIGSSSQLKISFAKKKGT